MLTGMYYTASPARNAQKHVNLIPDIDLGKSLWAYEREMMSLKEIVKRKGFSRPS